MQNCLKLYLSKDTSINLKRLRSLKNKIKMKGTKTVCHSDILLPFVDEYIKNELIRIEKHLKLIKE
jgi:hypothetical protein